MKDALEIAGIFIGLLVASIILIMVLAAAFSPLKYVSCQRQAERMDMPYKWDFWSGCYFQLDDGSWVEKDYYIVPELE